MDIKVCVCVQRPEKDTCVEEEKQCLVCVFFVSPRQMKVVLLFAHFERSEAQKRNVGKLSTHTLKRGATITEINRIYC